MIGINSDNTVELQGLIDTGTQVLIDNATVTGKLLDSNSVDIFDFTLTSLGSGGNYKGLITAASVATLTPGNYFVQITATANSGKLTLHQEHQALILEG